MFPVAPPPPQGGFQSFPLPAPYAAAAVPLFAHAAGLPPPPPPHAAMPYTNGGVAVGHTVAPVAPPALALEIRPVTAANYEAQLDVIGSLLPRYPLVAIDTEYPGIVHRPPPGRSQRQLAPPERYALVKANVDEIPIVQLGITLFDQHGNLPLSVGCHGRPVEISWWVTFSDFDARRDPHAPDSVAFLRSQGVDFGVSRALGVSSAAFGAKLAAVLSSTAPRRGELTWAAFGGAYDFAYMVKMLSGGQPLPATWHEFMSLATDLLGGRVFDGKYMAEHSGRDDLCVGGLTHVAASLGVPSLHPEPPCLAGPKSRTTCHIYTAMRKHFNEQDHGVRRRSIGQEDHCASACFNGLIDGFH